MALRLHGMGTEGWKVSSRWSARASFSTYFAVLGEMPSATALSVGGAGYIALALMAATSTDWAQRALGLW